MSLGRRSVRLSAGAFSIERLEVSRSGTMALWVLNRWAGIQEWEAGIVGNLPPARNPCFEVSDNGVSQELSAICDPSGPADQTSLSYPLDSDIRVAWTSLEHPHASGRVPQFGRDPSTG